MIAHKVANDLIRQMNTIANHEPMPVIVRRRATTFLNEVSFAAAEAVDVAERLFDLFPANTQKVTSAEIEAMSDNDDVEYIWPDLPVQAWLNSSVPKIQAPKVWASGFQGEGIKVAVLDTGIDETHPDFSGRIKATKSFVGETAHDDNGHGTHVAGIIAGSGQLSNGKYRGVAPEAELYIGKVLNENAGGLMSDVMAGIEWAVLEQNVQIINMSLGAEGPSDGNDALSVLCDEAVLQSGVVLCVAAGNLGPNPQTIGSPGCARFVITVGAIDDHDNLAWFSSRGPSVDGRIKPDIVFPGVQVIAPAASGVEFGYTSENGYTTSDGTSMAAPHAAGIAALMLQANPQLSAAQVKTRLVASGTTVGAVVNAQGIGLGDAYRAYTIATQS